MKIILLYNLLMLIALFFSCTSSPLKKDKNYSGITFPLSPKDVVPFKSSFTLDSFHNQVNGYQLDSSGGMIGTVNKFMIWNDKIFILDSKYAKSLFVFRASDGKFVRKIGKEGKGPSEFVRIMDFEIDSENNRILLNYCGRVEL